ncbi:MAG: sterol desaturase family protein [Bacteroidetes bacterium]|nr:sterol desaturase family protein [Fibrella sp.]
MNAPFFLQANPLWFTLIVFLSHLLRYALVAGLFFGVWYGWKKKDRLARKIQQRLPKNKDYQREILYSLGTVLVFTGITLIMTQPAVRQYTLVYTRWTDYSTAYGVASFFGLILFHDTYFYWTHRAMHDPRLFKIVHLVHHKSTNPSPWAAYAFHPIEAIVEAAIVPLSMFIMPLHPLTIFVFLVFMIIYNVYGHLGWELYPKNFNRHWLGKWLNTSVNHNQHHQFFTGNYGLYFRWWDEWMGTTRADYDAAFDRVAGK